MTINELVYIAVAIISVVCYCVVRYTKIPVHTKDIIRIVLGIMVFAITIYALVYDSVEYILGFLAAEYIFKAFDTSNDE